MELTTEVVALAKALYAQCGRVHASGAACGALAFRVLSVVDRFARRPASPPPGSLDNALSALKDVLLKAQALVSKLAEEEQGARGRLLDGATEQQVDASESLERLNADLARNANAVLADADVDVVAPAGDAVASSIASLDLHVAALEAAVGSELSCAHADVLAAVTAILSRLAALDTSQRGSTPTLAAMRVMIVEELAAAAHRNARRHAAGADEVLVSPTQDAHASSGGAAATGDGDTPLPTRTPGIRASGSIGEPGPGNGAASPHQRQHVDAFVIPASRLAVDKSRKIGEGAFGAVYAASLLPHSGSGKGRAVAVKVLFPHRLVSDAQLAAFKEEVAMQHGLSLTSDSVVAVLGLCTDWPGAAAGCTEVALVMDRMLCGLDRVLYDRRVQLGTADALQLLADVAVGVAHLHANGVVHGDIKSLNVLLDWHGRARLSDFGLAQMKATTRTHAALTKGGSMSASMAGGTAQWMAPELVDPKHKPPAKPSAATDAFALGMLFYEVLTRSVPWSGELDNPQIQAPLWVLAGERPTLDRIPATVPRALVALIQRLWAQTPAERPSLAAVVEELRRALIEGGEQPARAYLSALDVTVPPPPAGSGYFPDGDLADTVSGSHASSDNEELRTRTQAAAAPAVGGAARASRSLAEPTTAAEEKRRFLTDGAAIAVAIRQLTEPGVVADDVAHACSQLARLAAVCDVRKAAIVDVGAIPAIVAALRKHWQSPTVAAAGWSAIGSVTCGTADVAGALAAVGALRWLFAKKGSLRVFAGIRGVREAALTALARCRIRQIALDGLPLGLDGARTLAGSLGSFAELATMSLRSTALGADAIHVLTLALARAPQLTALHLGSNAIRAEGAIALAGVLAHAAELTTLEVKANGIGVEGAVALAGALARVPKLSMLDVGANAIQSDGARAVAAALCGLHHLRTLEMSSNDFGDEGAGALADALRYVPRLNSLNVASNGISDKGAQAVAMALGSTPDLTVLNVSDNHIGNQGAMALAAALALVPGLRTLAAGDNLIGDDGATALAARIVHVPRLQMLELQRNRIGGIFSGAKSSLRKAMPVGAALVI